MGKSPDNDIKETPEQKEAARIAAEKWQHYGETYVPVENEYMRRVDDMQSDWQHDMATGSTNKAYQEVLDKATGDTALENFSAGADPSSGRFQGGLADVAEAGGKAMGEAKVNADQAQVDRYVGGVKNIVNMGQGVSADAQMGLQDVANRSANEAVEKASDTFRSGQDNRQMAGMALGAGINYSLNKDE